MTMCCYSIRPIEFEKSLALPAAQIFECHVYRTILDFFLLKLRTALDRDWLQSLPILHKAICFLFVLISKNKFLALISAFSLVRPTAGIFSQ